MSMFVISIDFDYNTLSQITIKNEFKCKFLRSAVP